ncbi:MAG: ATP-binding protein [Schwartzia sp.]|nr:ATP-binding protein [Schwartzia sp. (in: firmicutes)]
MTIKQDVLTVAANDDEMDAVTEFLDGLLEDTPCGAEARAQLDMAVEEIFVNISHYAYGEENGAAVLRGSVTTEPPYTVTLAFEDEGVPFNPLERKTPDLTPAVRRRQVGGLGIFLARSMSDEIDYERKDGKNILTIKKNMCVGG